MGGASRFVHFPSAQIGLPSQPENSRCNLPPLHDMKLSLADWVPLCRTSHASKFSFMPPKPR
eukprot:5059935-Amphidinium_carterae.1